VKNRHYTNNGPAVSSHLVTSAAQVGILVFRVKLSLLTAAVNKKEGDNGGHFCPSDRERLRRFDLET